MKKIYNFIFEEEDFSFTLEPESTSTSNTTSPINKNDVTDAGIKSIEYMLSNAEVRGKVIKALTPSFNKKALEKALQPGPSEKLSNSPSTKPASTTSSTTGTKGPGSKTQNQQNPLTENTIEDIAIRLGISNKADAINKFVQTIKQLLTKNPEAKNDLVSAFQSGNFDKIRSRIIGSAQDVKKASETQQKANQQQQQQEILSEAKKRNRDFIFSIFL